jgi:hypothetical protein
MSYDIWLEIDSGGEEPVTVYDWNYTSNCARMWRHAGADLADFHGKPVADCIPILAAGIEAMESDPDTYRSMDPDNGWGSYASVLPALQKLLGAMKAHPLTTVRVWR